MMWWARPKFAFRQDKMTGWRLLLTTGPHRREFDRDQRGRRPAALATDARAGRGDGARAVHAVRAPAMGRRGDRLRRTLCLVDCRAGPSLAVGLVLLRGGCRDP